jgi:hypothetical protein
MNYGRFFVLDEDSRLDKGVTVFNYLWLNDEKNTISERTSNKETRKYPIYVSITKEAINFYSHYFYEEPEEPEKKDKHRKSRHQHELILSLPLSENLDVKDGLTTALVEAYNAPYPIYDKGANACNYQLGLLEKKIRSEKFCKEKDNMSYWNLDTFHINPKIKIFKEKCNALILEISDILKKNIPEITNEEEIASCFFNEILIRNDNFDTWIKRVQLSYKIELSSAKNELENFRKKETIQKIPVANWFIHKLILDFLFDLEHTKVFQNCPYYEHLSIRLKENFFFSALANKADYYYNRKIIKAELESNSTSSSKQEFLYDQFSKIEEIWAATIRNPKSDFFFIIDQNDGWFNEPEKEMESIYNECEIHQNTKKKRCVFLDYIQRFNKPPKTQNRITLFQKIEYSDDNNGEKRERERRVQLRKNSRKNSKWFLQKFDFRNALFNHKVSTSIKIFLILFCILNAVSVIFFPRLLITIPWIWVVLFLIISLLWGINYYIIRKCKSATDYGIINTYYSYGMFLFIPRLFAAIFAVWMTLTFSEDLFRVFFDIKLSPFWVLIPIILLFFFVSSEINKSVPYIKLSERIKRTATLLYIAFFYSFSIGFCVTGIVGDRFLERSGFVKDFYEDHVLFRNADYAGNTVKMKTFLVESFYNEFLLKEHFSSFDSIFTAASSITKNGVLINKMSQSLFPNEINLACRLNEESDNRWEKRKKYNLKWCKFNKENEKTVRTISAIALYIITESFNELENKKHYHHYADTITLVSNLDSIPKELYILPNKTTSSENLKLQFRKQLSSLLATMNCGCFCKKCQLIGKITNVEISDKIWQNYLTIMDSDILYKENLKCLKRKNCIKSSILYEMPILAKWTTVRLNILPNFLLQFTFIAMFIGIFIQLIFEQRKITESD